jgi:hypothetical protein
MLLKNGIICPCWVGKLWEWYLDEIIEKTQASLFQNMSILKLRMMYNE